MAVGRLRDGVAVRPLGAAILGRDGIGLRVEVFPAPPLPHDLAPGRHLDEIVRIDHAVGLGAGLAAADVAGDLGGQRRQAQEENVPVAEPAGVVMMVRVPDFPENAPSPVHLEHGAALEAGPRLEPLEVLQDLAAVKEVAVFVEAGRVRQTPGVGRLTVHVDEMDGAVAEHRSEESVARLGARGVVGDEPGSRAPDLLLVHGAHAVSLAVGASIARAFARSASGRGAERRASRSRWTPDCSSVATSSPVRRFVIRWKSRSDELPTCTSALCTRTRSPDRSGPAMASWNSNVDSPRCSVRM